MSKITCEDIIEFMENIQNTYRLQRKNPNFHDFTALIHDLRNEIADGNNETKIKSMILLLEKEFRNEIATKCCQFLSTTLPTDNQITHLLNIHANNHYPKLLGLALTLKQIYNSDIYNDDVTHLGGFAPNLTLRKIVSGLNPVFNDIYKFEIKSS